MTQDFLKDFLKYLPAQITPALVGFITVPIITRLFPPGDYGNYVLAMATINIMITIIGWLGMSIIRFYPAYERDNKQEYLYTSIVKLLFISLTVLTAVFLSILLIFKSFIPSQLYYLMLVGTGIFILMSVFQVLQHFLMARRQVSWYTGFSVWHSVAALGIGITLAMRFRYGVEGLLWGYILSLTVVLPLLWKITLGRQAFLSGKRISIELTKEMAKYGLPLVVGNLAAWILSLSDRYVLEFFQGAQEVGIYSASYTISEYGITILVSLFMLSAGPISMNIWEKEGMEKGREFITRITRYYLLLCLPATVGLSVLAKPAIEVLTAPEYHGAYHIMPFVSFGAFFLGLQQRFQSGLVFYKRTNLIMAAVIVSGLLNLGLNFWLVPIYGYMAAAVTTFISYAFLLGVMIIVSRKYFVFDFPFKSLAKAACASAVMAAVVYPVGNSITSSAMANLFLGIVVGIVVYILMIFLLREPQKEEIQEMRIIRARIRGRK